MTKIRTMYDIPRLIKGHWQLSDDHLRFSSFDRSQALRDMDAFAESGINVFDVADIYTGAEELIGEYIRQGGRNKIHVHTKYVPDMPRLGSIDYRDTKNIIERSLRRLGLDQLDLVQFHWWDYGVRRYVEVAQHLVQLQREGKIRHIGVTNFDALRLAELLSGGVNIVSAQVQYSVLDRRVENGFAAFCAHHDIGLLCYGALAGGFISAKYLGALDEYRDLAMLENRSLTKYRLIIEEAGGWGRYQDILTVLDTMATKYNVTLSEIALAYVLMQKQVAACIVGAHNSKHLPLLKRVLELEIEPQDIVLLRRHVEKLMPIEGDLYEVERTSDRHKNVMKYDLNARAP